MPKLKLAMRFLTYDIEEELLVYSILLEKFERKKRDRGRTGEGLMPEFPYTF